MYSKAESIGGTAEEQKSAMRVQIQKEIDKQPLNFRYYTYILVSIIFTDNTLLILVGPSYVFVFYKEICQKWSFFSLREHFSGAKTWL